MKHQKLIYWLVGIFAVVFIGGALIIPTPTIKQQVVSIGNAITGILKLRALHTPFRIVPLVKNINYPLVKFTSCANLK